MKNVTNQYKNNIASFGRELDSKITYTIDGVQTELGNGELNSVTPHYEGGILKSVMKQLDIDSNVDIPEGTIINYQFGVKTGNIYEYIDLGNYIVYSTEKQEDTYSYKITCYDKMLYSMVDYETLEIAYPITIRNYINAICTKLGLTFANASDTFANYDREIQNELYLDNQGNSLGYTFRDVLDELAQVTASTICINNDDELEIRYINETQSKNLFNFDNYISKSAYVEIISQTEDTLVATVTQSSTWNTIRYNITNLKKNTNYSFKFNFDNTNDSELYKHTWLTIRDESNSILYNTAYYKNNVVTFNTGNSTTIGFLFHVTINSPAVVNTITISKVQLEEGTSVGNYEPYGLDTIDEKYLKDINVNFGEKYGPVNSIVLSRASESDNVYLRDEESVEENGLCEIKIKENQIMNFNDRADYLEDILTELDGLEYYINDFSSTGITYYELCDKYNISIDNNTYDCIMLNDEINISQGLEEIIHTEILEESETDYKKADKTDRKINQTYIIADKQRGEIEALTSRTTTLENETNNMYTIDQVNQLVQNAETGITNTFSEAGGNNIFRNTGLWFQDNSNRDLIYPSLDLYPSDDLFSGKEPVYEYWTGDVEKLSEDRASNQTALLLQANTLGQRQDVPNGTYTISFMYQKLIQLGTVKCYINDVEYNLTETQATEFIQTIEVKSQYISINFESDVDNGCEIYDLMVNAGTVKLAYSQNQNETTTDTVNISKGITITSSDTDTTFKANSDGIRIYDSKDLNLPKTKFTDKGTETDYLKVKNEAEIVDILIQKVGSHTWLTKI